MLIWGDAGENERVVLKHRDQLSCLEGAERKELLDELKQHCNAMYLYPGHCTQVAGIIVVNTQPARNTRGSNWYSKLRGAAAAPRTKSSHRPRRRLWSCDQMGAVGARGFRGTSHCLAVIRKVLRSRGSSLIPLRLVLDHRRVHECYRQ
jgi:hypothetical protein